MWQYLIGRVGSGHLFLPSIFSHLAAARGESRNAPRPHATEEYYGLRFSWLALHLVFLKVTTRIFPRTGSVGSAGWLFQNTWVSGDVPGVSPRLTPEIFCSQPLVKIISLSRTRTALLQLIASSLNTLCNAWDNGLNKSFSKRISLNPGII